MYTNLNDDTPSSCESSDLISQAVFSEVADFPRGDSRGNGPPNTAPVSDTVRHNRRTIVTTKPSDLRRMNFFQNSA